MSSENSLAAANKSINTIFPQKIPFADDQEWVEYYLLNRSRFPVKFKITPFPLERRFTVAPDSGFLEPQESTLVRITRKPGARREVKYRGNVSMSSRSHVALWEEKQIPPIGRTANVREVLRWSAARGLAEKVTTTTEKVSSKTEIISVSPQEIIAASDKDWVEFTVQNLSRHRIAFKIRGSRVEEFTAKPSKGYIEPGKSETVRILRIRDPLHPPCSCERFVRFLLLAKEVTRDDRKNQPDPWNMTPEGVYEKILKCQFINPDGDQMNRGDVQAQCMKEAFFRIKNWLRALNAILVGLVFISFVLLLVGAIVCYKIYLLVHLHHLTPGGGGTAALPFVSRQFRDPLTYVSSFFCK